MPSDDGCPVCDWDGEVATTHDYTHEYHTHVVVRDGELFRGPTCSMRTRPRGGSKLLARLRRWWSS